MRVSIGACGRREGVLLVAKDWIYVPVVSTPDANSQVGMY